MNSVLARVMQRGAKTAAPVAVSAIPRVALTWLLVAQALVIVPQLTHLPLWIIGLWLVCAGWRIQIYRMRAAYPTRPYRIVLMLFAASSVVLSRGSLIGLDAGAVLLTAAFILKLVEMRSRRDALVVIFLGFFVVVVGYLFDDGLVLALLSLLPIVALLAAMIGLQQSSLATHPLETLRVAGSLLLQAVPLMIVLFLFFPRFGPIWSLPMSGSQGVVGLADNMTPADIAQLSQSSELAFRVSFDGPLPAHRTLYWRALTLQQFDGRRWSQGAGGVYGPAPAWEKRGPALHYNVIMQPSGQSWLFSLDIPETTAAGTRLGSDFSLRQRSPVSQALQYSATSWPQALRQTKLDKAQREQALQLPETGDPRSRAWAKQLQAQYPQPEALVQALLRHFNQEPYFYTLKPQVLGVDSVDEFLFDTRRGFCAHYAGAMTFVLRAAGIPTRVVAGYQGGELNPDGNYLAVRQYDAHAWVEYWREGQGWTSVDPTFQVAPSRIEQGLEQALDADEDFQGNSAFTSMLAKRFGWINSLRMTWDNLNYDWQRWVLGYRNDQQLQLFQRLFGSADWQKIGIGLVAGLAGLMAALALWLFKPWRRQRDPQQREFQKFETLLARHALHRHTGEGARAFAERAMLHLPTQAAAIEAFAVAFEAQRYGGQPESVRQLRPHLQQLRRSLPWRS